MSTLEQKVHRFHVYQATASYAIWIPFWALWIRRHVASDFELTLVDIAFWVGLLVFQLPAGVFADRYGRKRTIMLSESIRSIGILGYGLGSTFLEYQAVNVVWSLGAAFSIGTSAYLYETLLEAGHESEFPRIIGRNTMVQLLANAAGAFTGGLLVAVTGNIQDTMILGAAINALSVGVVATFVEPKVSRVTEPTFARQLVQGWHVVRRREGIALLIAAQVAIGVTLYTIALFRPLYFTEALGLPEAQIGLWVAAFLLGAAVVAGFSGRIAAALGEFGTIALVVVLPAAAFLGIWFLGSVWYAVVLQAPIYVAWSLQPPMTTAFMNRRLEPGQRATVLSMGAFAYTLALVVVLPLTGLVTTSTGDLVGLGLILGLGTLLPGLAILAFWRVSVAPWPAVTPLPSRLVPGAGTISRFHRLFERMSRLRP